MNSHIPNSEDLFQIYKENLNTIKSIHEVIVKGKMDRRFFRTLREAIKDSTEILNDLVLSLNEISLNIQGAMIGSKTMRAFGDIIDGYMDIMTKVSKIPIKSLLQGKIQLWLFKRQISNMLEFASTLGDISVVKVKLAQMNLKMLEPIMESIQIVTAPLNKITIKDILSYNFTILKYRLIFRKIKKLIKNIASIRITAVYRASKNTELIASVFDNIFDILSRLQNKITFKQLREYRKYIRQLHRLFFKGSIVDRLLHKDESSVISIIEELASIYIGIPIKAALNAKMINNAMLSIFNILQLLSEEMSSIVWGFFEKLQKKRSLKRISDIICGEENSVVALMRDVADTIGIRDSISATLSIMAAVVFMKAVNIVLHSIPKGKIKRKLYRKRLDELYKIIIGEGDDDHKSLLTLMKTIAQNEDSFKKGTQISIEVLKGIVEMAVNIFKNLKEIESARIGVKSINKLVQDLFEIVKYITDKRHKFKEKSEEAQKIIETMITNVTKLNDLVNKTPKVKEVLLAMVSIVLMRLFVRLYFGLCKLILKKQSEIEDKKALEDILTNINNTISSLAQIVAARPDIKGTLGLILVMGAMYIVVFEYAGLVKLTNFIYEKWLKDATNEQVKNIIASVGEIMTKLSEALKDIPKLKDVGRLMLVIPMLMLVVYEYKILLKITSQGRTDRKNVQKQAIQVIKDIASITKEFSLAVKLCPTPQELSKALPSLAIMMLIITGFLLVINVLTRQEQVQGRRSRRAMRMMKFTIGGVLAIVLAMVVVGALVILGVVVIAAAIAFIGVMVGLMAALSLASNFIKKGALALALIELCIIGLALCMAPFVIMANTIDPITLLKFLGVTALFIVGITGIIVALGFLIEKKEMALALAEGAGILTWAVVIGILLGKVMWQFAQISNIIGEDGGGRLLAVTQISILFIGELTGIAIVLGKISENPEALLGLAAGSVILGLITGVAWLLGEAMRPFGEITNIIGEGGGGRFLGVTQTTALFIVEITAIAGALGALAISTMGIGAGAILTGVGLIATIAGAMWTVSESMKAITQAYKEIEASGLTGNTINETIQNLRNVIMIPIQALMGAPDSSGNFKTPDGVMKGSVLDLLDQVGGKQSFKIAVKVKSLSSIISSIADIGKSFEELSQSTVNINQEGLKGVTAIVSGAKKILELVADDNLEKVTVKAKIRTRRLYKIVQSIGKMAITLQDISSLRIPTEFDKDGKAIAYEKMTGTDLINAAQNASVIMRIFALMFDDSTKHKFIVNGTPITVGGENLEATLENIRMRSIRKMRRILELSEPLSQMVDVIKNVSDMVVPDEIDPKTGKPKSYKKLKSTEMVECTKNIAEIVSEFIKAVDFGTSENTPLTDVLKDITVNQAQRNERVEMITNIMDPIAKILDAISKLYNMKIPDVNEDGTLKLNKDGSIAAWKAIPINEIKSSGVEVANLVKDFVNNIDLGQDTNIMRGLWDSISGAKSNREERMKMITEVMDPISKLMDMIDKFYNAKYPASIDKDGKVTEWKLLRASDVSTVKIFDILKTFITNLTTIGENNSKFIKKLETAKTVVDTTIGSVENISKLTTYLELCNKYPDIKFKEMSGIGTDTDVAHAIVLLGKHLSLVSWNTPSLAAVPSVANSVMNFKPYLEMVQEFSDIKFVREKDHIDTVPGLTIKKLLENLKHTGTKTQVQNFERSVSSSVKLVRSINTLDVTKANALKEVLSNLYKFSASINGNFDKLADIINTKLIDAIQKLEEVLKQVSDKEFKVTTETQTAPANKTSIAQMTAPKQGNNNPQTNTTNQQNAQIVNNLKEAIKKLSDAIEGSGSEARMRIKTE